MRVKIVARYLDGRVLKGQTDDFGPAKPGFHLTTPPQADVPSRIVDIKLSDLKAVFFVRDLLGDAAYNEEKAFPAGAKTPGKRLQVVFLDGEVLVGTTQAYQPERTGFFLIPVDTKSNNERCFVVMSSVKNVSFV